MTLAWMPKSYLACADFLLSRPSTSTGILHQCEPILSSFSYMAVALSGL